MKLDVNPKEIILNKLKKQTKRKYQVKKLRELVQSIIGDKNNEKQK